MSADVHLNLLDRVEILQPCPVSWRSMQRTDDAAVRFCPQCSKNVYSFSAMSREDAERMLAANEGQLCAQIRRRRNGTVITRNIPALRFMPRWISAVAASIAGIVSLLGMGCGRSGGSISMPTGGKVCAPQTDHVDSDSRPAEPSPNVSQNTSANPPFLWDGVETFGYSGRFEQ